MTGSPDNQSHPLRIFLCHAHEDKDAVLKLYRRLQSDGFQPWMDKQDLVPGQDWQTEIRKAVRESQIFLACVSNRSVTKAGFVNREINFALDVAEEQPEGAIFVIPVRLEDCKVPDRLRRWHWCDYFEKDGYRTLMRAFKIRARQLGLSLEQWKQQQQTTPRPRPTMPSLPKVSLPGRAFWFAGVGLVGVVLALWALVSTPGGGNGRIIAPTATPTKTPQIAVVDTATPTETPTPVPPTPTLIAEWTNPLFPVTIEEWRNETQNRSTEFTREGDHYWRYGPGGTYTIGGWTDDKWENNDPQADVTLEAYWIARYPVTVQQYR